MKLVTDKFILFYYFSLRQHIYVPQIYCYTDYHCLSTLMTINPCDELSWHYIDFKDSVAGKKQYMNLSLEFQCVKVG